MATGERYKDKVTIITGGSSGIGKGCAKVFVSHGSKVVICSNNESEGKEAEKELSGIGSGEVMYIFADVTKKDDIKNLINRTVDKYGRIDCVINNAGWHPPYATIDDYTAEEFKSLLDLNVVGYFLVAKHALPHLRKTEGNIVNISSMEGHQGAGMSTIYGATKGAVSAFTRALAIDEARYNVRVNTISPGYIATPLCDQFIKTSPNPDASAQHLSNISVMGRPGKPEEIGMSCLYLAADATFCTGIDHQVSGGTAINYGCKNSHLPDVWPKNLLK